MKDVFTVGDVQRRYVDTLINDEWRIRAWWQKPAHFVDTQGYPEWHDFLRQVTPKKPYWKNGKPHEWEPVQFFNTQWRSSQTTHQGICALLDAGTSVALGKFQREKGKTRRRASLQKKSSGIFMDCDEDIPAHIVTCEDLIKEIPILHYATGIRESASSRSERKNGLSQFRVYWGLETPLKVNCGEDKVAVRTREKIGEFLASQIPFAPEDQAKNAVCVAYGNAASLSRYNSHYLISDVFVQSVMKEAEAEIEAEAAEEKRKAEKQKKWAARREKSGSQRLGSPIQVFIETVDPVRYMEERGWLMSLGGGDFRWHESSSAGRSCNIKDGVIHIFSSSMNAASPEDGKPVSAYRFLLYYLYGIDVTVDADKPKLREMLAADGYGESLEDFKKRNKAPIPPLEEMLRLEAEAMERSIEKAPEAEPRYTPKPPKLIHSDTPPQIETETLEKNRDNRAKAADTFLSAETPEETTHFLLVKDATGTGKTHTYIAKGKAHGKRTLAQFQHTGMAQQAVDIAFKEGYRNPYHLLGREHNWEDSGISAIPIPERTRDLFSRNNCIMVDVLQAYTDKRIAHRNFCETFCPHHYEDPEAAKKINICPHLAQYEGLEERDFLASCTSNLLFDLGFRGYLKSIVTATNDPTDEDMAMDAMMGTESHAKGIFDFAILDDYGVNALYSDIILSGAEFKRLEKAWSGTPTAAFAKLIRKAFKKKKPQKIVKALRTAFQSTAEDHEAIAKSLTQHVRNGTVQFADRPKARAEDKSLLAEKEIRYDDGGRTRDIAVNFEAYKYLKEKKIPAIRPRTLESEEIGAKVRDVLSPTGALRADVPLNALTPVWIAGATPIEILEIFLKSIGNDKNAPIKKMWRGGQEGEKPNPILLFSIPPQAPIGIIPNIALLSATTETEDTKRAFDGQNVTFSAHTGLELERAKGVSVCQFQDARITSASVFDYEKNAAGKRKLQSAPIGLTKTATRRLQKLNDWAKETEGLTAFISYKEFTDETGAFAGVVDGFDVVTHFDKVAGLNFDGLKFLVVFGYPKVKHEVVMEDTRKQHASDSEPLPKADPKVVDEKGKVISEYMQLTEEATHTENGITISERRYKDPRLEKIRHQLATEKLAQAIGRARLPVWTDTTTLIITNAPIEGITERATLFSSAAFTLAETPSNLPSAMEHIRQVEEKGSVEDIMEVEKVSKRTAFYRRQSKTATDKAERDAEICRKFADGASKNRIATQMGINWHTVDDVLKRQSF